ncbi:MAG: hypothetical protein JSS66_05255 [Armatimonadetes bacterium]|nr:hypothetical protein [Armatimonadota bacterium]
MAKSDVTYQESVNLYALARQLQERYYLHLGYIDMDVIFFAEKIGEKPVKASVIETSGVRSPWVRQVLSQNSSHKRYCVAAWSGEWSKLPYPKQEWMMFDALYSIGVTNDGKLRSKDVLEHGIIADFLGVYWRGEDDVPSLLSSEDPLPIPPPPIEHDEGSTIAD